MERYLITGASGHLGTTIVNQLLESNQKVRVLVMSSDKNVDFLSEKVEIIYGDVTNLESLEAFFTNPNQDRLIVIHCAGIVSIASAYNQKIHDVNVNGTKNVLSMCQRNQVSKLIYISSVHAIEEKPKGQIITEVDHFDQNLVRGAYAKSKAEASQAVLQSIKNGLNGCIIHPSGIIGPNDFGRSHVSQLIIDFYNGKLVAAVNGGYDFVDVRDVAQGVLQCVKKGQKGHCYILSNKYYKVSEILEILHKTTGKKRVTFVLPSWFAKVTAPFAELYYKILRQPPLYTAYSLYTLTSNANFSHEKATTILGYTTRPMENTIVDAIAWLRQHKRI